MHSPRSTIEQLDRQSPGFTPGAFPCVRTLDDADAHVQSLWFNVEQLAGRVRELEKLQDVWDTPWWKLALFVIDGWPLRRVVARPQWRPWRRWWTS